MSSIDDMISELAGIPGALRQWDGDPRQRPRPPPSRVERSSERVREDPIFEAAQWQIADRDLWEEQKERARRAIEGDGVEAVSSGGSQSGTDALAWYVSFHLDQRAWGIYIPLSGLSFMDDLYLSSLTIERERRLQLAWTALLLHERMHFAVDYVCGWFELMLRAPIRREFIERFNSRPPLPELKTSEPYLIVEETAANAHMLRELSRRERARQIRLIERFVGDQPPGYREGLDAVGDAPFAQVVADTLRSYIALWAIEHRLDLGNRAMNFTQLLPLGDQNIVSECPVYMIDDLEDIGLGPGSVRLIQRIGEIVEADAFERQLRRLHSTIRGDWTRMKEQIKERLPPPPRFEKLKDWHPPTWSIRLRSGHRVHLHAPEPGTATWRAVAIGNHKEMGHG
jgi:hypothetical protein